MEKNTSPAKEPKILKKQIVVKTADIEKEIINSDCSNELSPNLHHISNLMSPHTIFHGSLKFLHSDVASLLNFNKHYLILYFLSRSHQFKRLTKRKKNQNNCL